MLRASCVLLDAGYAKCAKALLANGYSPLPILAGSKRPGVMGWQEYCDRQPQPQMIDNWSASWPGAGVGVACGAIIAIDIDSDDETIIRAVTSVLPHTSVTKRGRKGWTLFYRNPHGAASTFIDGRASDGKRPRLVDVLARGKQTVIPPTIHPDTLQPYAWGGEATLMNTPLMSLAVFPVGGEASIREALIASGHVESIARRTKEYGHLHSPTPENRLIAYGESVLTALCDELTDAPEGQRNQTLFKAACRIGAYIHHGVIPQSIAYASLASACEANGLIRGKERDEFEATFASALEKSARDPYPTLQDRPHPAYDARTIDEMFGGKPGVLPAGASAVPLLTARRASDMLGEPAPPRQWCVTDLIPHRQVTLLSGDGGVGKTTLMMQLCMSAASNTPFLGKPVRPSPALFVSAEDEIEELHFRIHQIAGPNRQGGLNHFHMVSLSDCDHTALVEAVKPKAPLTRTPVFTQIEAMVRELGAGLLVLDPAADLFGGDEIDRRQVQTFIRMLRKLARDADCTVVLCAHPSVDAMKTGRGFSGSTAWNNSVRSRLYFTKSDEDEDMRILELAKSNRSKIGMKFKMQWISGRFVIEDKLTALHNYRPEEVFLKLLRKRNDQGRPVSDKSGKNYAPKLFSHDPDNENITKHQFEKAMERLFSMKKIKTIQTGRPSQPVSSIIFDDFEAPAIDRLTGG